MKQRKIINLGIGILFLLGLIISCDQVLKIEAKDTQLPSQALSSIKKLLSSKPENGGFIILTGDSELEYVQYFIERCGLLLDWPIVENNKFKNKEQVNKVSYELKKKGFQLLKVSKISRNIIEKLKYKEYVIDSSGLNANVGNNALEIMELTSHLFINVYGKRDLSKIKIELGDID